MKASDFSEVSSELQSCIRVTALTRYLFHNERPATQFKRPRLMGRPDGFHKDARAQEILVAAPSFASAFDNNNPEPVAGSSKIPNTPLAKARRAPQFQIISPQSATSELKSTKTFRLAPVPSPARKPGQPPQRKTVAITSFQPTVPSHQDDSPAKVFPILQRTPVPASISNKSNAATLKPIPPPIPLSTSNDNASPKKDMKSIFSTRVALATDHMTDGGHAELLSISLQGQHTSPSDAELVRGVLSSPEKGSRSRGAKYMR